MSSSITPLHQTLHAAPVNQLRLSE